MLYLKVKQELDGILGCDAVLERPKNREFGHFATPIAFMLAKTERKNPKVLSEEIAEKLRLSPLFEKVETLNGYINLTLSQSLLLQSVSSILSGDFQKEIPKKNYSILLEYVSANPTGPLHIGHARGAIYGDALLRLGRFSGYEIKSEYYINDAGSQISMLGFSILLAGREILNIPVEYPEQYYRGEYIFEIAHKAIAQFGSSYFKEENIPHLAEFGKDLMLEEIKGNLASVGIEFDFYVSEKSLYDRWNQVLEKLKKYHGTYEKEEKLWLKSTQHKDEKDRVIVRESGEPTYLAGDIIYHEDKFLRPFDHYINIWGADHHGYIARVKSAIEFLGFDSSKLEVLLSQMVKLLKDGMPYKMSKRAGNFILMQDVVEEIGSDALRFVFLAKTPDIGLEFEISDLQRQDSSNPIFYINYANARIHTLIEKSQKSFEEIKSIEITHLDHSLQNLAFLASQISSVAVNAFEDRSPLKMCDFLKNLAAELHAFYNANKILGMPNQNEILKILLSVSMSLEKGMELLGIKAKRKM